MRRLRTSRSIWPNSMPSNSKLSLSSREKCGAVPALLADLRQQRLLDVEQGLGPGLAVGASLQAAERIDDVRLCPAARVLPLRCRDAVCRSVRGDRSAIAAAVRTPRLRRSRRPRFVLARAMPCACAARSGMRRPLRWRVPALAPLAWPGLVGGRMGDRDVAGPQPDRHVGQAGQDAVGGDRHVEHVQQLR